MEEKYLPELMAEKDSLDPSFTHALRLVNQGEGRRGRSGAASSRGGDEPGSAAAAGDAQAGFNFVGKLLGPRGNSLKRLQEETLTKMSILGKGSMRDKTKEEELRKSGEAKYFHLNDDLHVLIEVFAPPAEAYARMGHALEEIKKFLIPDYNDEIRQAQLQELTYLNGGSENAEVPVVRGKPSIRARGVPVPALAR
ncbi:KHDR3 protein, partial [Fregetta grallaria]|nr:KHDR3 protein [Fregetta grallaria]